MDETGKPDQEAGVPRDPPITRAETDNPAGSTMLPETKDWPPPEQEGEDEVQIEATNSGWRCASCGQKLDAAIKVLTDLAAEEAKARADQNEKLMLEATERLYALPEARAEIERLREALRGIAGSDDMRSPSDFIRAARSALQEGPFRGSRI